LKFSDFVYTYKVTTHPEKKPRESEEDDGPTVESSNNWMLLWVGLFSFRPVRKRNNQTSDTQTRNQKEEKKREKNLPRVVTNVGDFCFFSRIRCCCCCCAFMYCDKLRILSRLFLSFPLTTRDLIFCIYFLFVFLLSFWYRGKSRCERARTATNVRHTAVDRDGKKTKQNCLLLVYLT
jgi:hypothetical protein